MLGLTEGFLRGLATASRGAVATPLSAGGFGEGVGAALAPVPEPPTALLLALGAAVLGAVARRPPGLRRR